MSFLDRLLAYIVRPYLDRSEVEFRPRNDFRTFTMNSAGAYWLSDQDQFTAERLEHGLFDITGHWHLLWYKPKVGDRIVAEFKRTRITFEIMQIDFMGDPQDQYFAKVRAIAQEVKQ